MPLPDNVLALLSIDVPVVVRIEHAVALGYRQHALCVVCGSLELT